MYRGGGVKMMEWTPPPDGICMCQGGVVVRPPEGGGIRVTGYHRRDRFGEAQLSASWCWGGRLCRVPQEAEPGEIAVLSRRTTALRCGDGGLCERPLLGPGDFEARPRGEVAPAGLRQALREVPLIPRHLATLLKIKGILCRARCRRWCPLLQCQSDHRQAECIGVYHPWRTLAGLTGRNHAATDESVHCSGADA